MGMTPSVRDRLKGARELTRAHEATIRAGEAILAALDVLFPDDDDEPGQAADEAAAAHADRLAEALRLTQEYVGSEVLPPIPGWSWFDALTAHHGPGFWERWQAEAQENLARHAASTVGVPAAPEEPIYGEGQVAADLAEAEAHREMAVRGRGHGWHMEDRLDGTTVCRACSLEGGGVHDFILLTSTTSAHWTAHAKAAGAATDQPVDYAASSAGQPPPPPPSCWRCEGVDEGEAWDIMLGLCYRHAADERVHARKLSAQVHDLDATVRAQAVALQNLAKLRDVVQAAKTALADAP